MAAYSISEYNFRSEICQILRSSMASQNMKAIRMRVLHRTQPFLPNSGKLQLQNEIFSR